MIALSGVRSSCDMFARNSDLCWFAVSSCRLLSWISRNRRTFSSAIAAWSPKVRRSPISRVAEWPHVRPAQQDRPERLAFAIERRDDHGAMAEALGDLVAQWVLGRLGQHVAHLNRLLVEQRTAGDRLTVDRQRIDAGHQSQRRGSLGSEVPQRIARRSRYIEAADASHRRAARSAIASSTGCTSVGELEITRRISLDRRLLLEGFLRLVEKTHVVDGDCRLPREGLHQRDLVRREQTSFSAIEEDAAVGAALAHQRNRQHGTAP